MQQRHEKEQQLLAQLEEAAKLHRDECTACKVRREVEAKAKKEAVEEEERKRKTMEYL